MNFDFDIGDPKQVAARTRELEVMISERNGAIDVLADEIRQLTAILATVGDRTVRRRRVAPAQDRAVAALEVASAELRNTAVGPTSLFKYMRSRGMDTPPTAAALGTNLYDAWKAGRIMRADNGVYTPLDGSGRTEWGRPMTDYYYAAELGLPIPH